MIDSATIMLNARRVGIALPAFNIAHLSMVKSIIQAVADEDSYAFIEVSRIDWEKFDAISLEAVADEFHKWADLNHVRLHLDHIPVIDEDGKRVNFLSIITRAIKSGYHSVMIDGSRLSLEENIQATRQVADLAHKAGIPCEAELGAVFGHEAGPPPPYEELFRTGKGFTDPAEARRFVQESNCDWLSVAIGNVHGAVTKVNRHKKKVEARLNLDHLTKLVEITGIPLVLHGGSGIREEDVREAFHYGIAKINVGTEIRQVYENVRRESGKEEEAREALYERTRFLIRQTYRLNDSYKILIG